MAISPNPTYGSFQLPVCPSLGHRRSAVVGLGSFPLPICQQSAAPHCTRGLVGLLLRTRLWRNQTRYTVVNSQLAVNLS
jgi:hypothetical protein